MLSPNDSVFDSLPARPPTPPIAAGIDAALKYLDDSNEIQRAGKQARPAADTPPEQSPLSSQERGAGTGPKRVGFHPAPTYHRISRFAPVNSPGSPHPKRTPSSQDAKPLKSILKLSSLPPPLTPEDLDANNVGNLSPSIPGSFRKMLQSAVHQLAGQQRSSRLDAYFALTGALQAHDGLVDIEAMRERMALITQFITRDMAWKDTDGALDKDIVTQSLKLAVMIVFDARMSKMLDDDFCTFLVDRCVLVLEQIDVSKPIVKIHMYFLAQQRFHPSIMTPNRAERIVAALRTIDSKVTGNSTVAARLVIYKRLVEQAPGVMLKNIRLWLDQVFHGMLSSVKEIRQRAIEVGNLSGLHLGVHYEASKAMVDLMETTVDEEQTYCDYVSRKLQTMIADKELGLFVPQIWSVVVLFFRNKKRKIETWRQFKAWLLVIQKCLNSSDLQLKRQANIAWNKLVFVVSPDSATSEAMISMLKLPITVGLEKNGRDKHSKLLRHIALNSYYNLLHYSLRPSLSHAELDIFWEAYVEPVLTDMAKSSDKGRHAASLILHGLLSSSSSGTWNDNAANQANVFKPEDLPHFDPRWIRSRLSKILRVAEPIISHGLLLVLQGDVAVEQMWNALMHSVAEAGSQEVKTSAELKDAIAHLMNALRRIWLNCPEAALGNEHPWLPRYAMLACAMIELIGGNHFVEDILSRNRQDDVEAAPTPSHRSSKYHQRLQSPIAFVFDLFYQPNQPIENSDNYYEAASALLRMVCSSVMSQAHRLEILDQLLVTSTSNYSARATAENTAGLWQIIAHEARAALDLDHTDAPDRISRQLGQQMRSVVSIWTVGLQQLAEELDSWQTSQNLYQALQSLYQAALRYVRKGAGDGGAVLAVVEPCAKAVVSTHVNADLDQRYQVGIGILNNVVWPRSRQALDHGRKALWGVGLAPHKAAVFDPFDEVYGMINELLLTSYNHPGQDAGLHDSLLAATAKFLGDAPLSLLAIALRRTQIGISYSIRDSAQQLSYGSSGDSGVVEIWRTVLRLIRSLPKKDSNLLKALGNLLTAGLGSSRRAIVNEAIMFWNETFGIEDSLEYPAGLIPVLEGLRARTEIMLPCFPESQAKMIPATIPVFTESQEDVQEHFTSPKPAQSATKLGSARSSPAPHTRVNHFNTARSTFFRPTSASSPAPISKWTSSKAGAKSKLRHEDSQIDFAPVDSSLLLSDVLEPQVLTDHQREVKARQQEQAAVMFPDLSSSPQWKSTARQDIPKLKLRPLENDGLPSADEERAATPTFLIEGEEQMDDYIGSSPAARASEREKTPRTDERGVVKEGEMVVDPPSSSPRSDDGLAEALFEVVEAQMIGRQAQPEDTAVDITAAGPDDLCQETAPDNATEISTPNAYARVPHETSAMQDPDEQLQQEAKDDSALAVDPRREATAEALPLCIADISTTNLETLHSDVYEDAPTELPEEQSAAGAQVSSPVRITDTAAEEQPIAVNHSFAESNVTTGDDVSRIENSLFEPGNSENAEKAPSVIGSPQSPRSSRKRKRGTAVYTPKQKQQSPFKRLISRFLGSREPEEEEDIGDEIVVASPSSHPEASSPNTKNLQSKTSCPSKIESEPSEPVEDLEDEFSKDIRPSYARLRTGRRRKSETPAVGVVAKQPSRRSSRSHLKRRASAISNTASQEGLVDATTVVEDTPAPRKVRKQRTGPDSQLILEAQLSQEESASSGGREGTSSRRTVIAVTIPAFDAGIEKTEDNEESLFVSDDDQDGVHPPASPDEQLELEQAAAARAQLSPRPKSICERLLSVYEDIKTAVFSSQEERQLDDALFDIRREVHEAARRGREG